MNESVMKEKIENYIHNNYCDVTRLVVPEESDEYGKRVDVFFIQGTARSLHIIEAEPSFTRCFNPEHGFAQLNQFRANFKWIAVPEEEIYDDFRKIAISSVCEKLGFGLMYVYQNQVREITQPTKTAGNFLKDYPLAEQEWYK